MDASDKTDLEAKSNALKQAISGSDTASIKSQMEELQKALYAVSEKLYKAAAPAGRPAGGRCRRTGAGCKRQPRFMTPSTRT